MRIKIKRGTNTTTMKTRLSIPVIAILLISSIASFSQVFLSEDCESGVTQYYKQEYVLFTFDWDTAKGGHTTDVGIPGSGTPPYAQQGDYNFFYKSGINGSITRLVSPPLDLQFALEPQLRFYYALGEWDERKDFLKIYFKASADDDWGDPIEEYTLAQDNWKKELIYLPEVTFSDSCYIAFEGINNIGHGVCLDSITVIETSLCSKKPDSVTIYQVNETQIPSGSSNNAMLRLDVSVSCNQDNTYLQGLTVNSDNVDDSDIKTNGVKLFVTSEPEFAKPVQVGSGVSINSGQAQFTGLNYALETGFNYLWVTYDVSETAVHLNTLDAYIPTDGINIDNTYYFPEADSAPDGYATVVESVFYDDFETDKGWTLTGEWEWGEPQGLGTDIGLNADPDYASGGLKVIGTDLSGLGDSPGDYEFNIDTPWTAVSPPINCKYYKDIGYRYDRFLNVEGIDTASVEYSIDTGKTWKRIFLNDLVRDIKWRLVNKGLPQVERQEHVLMRFSIGPTDDYKNYSGWNVDNFALTGNLLDKDVGVTEWVGPKTNCGLTASEQVQVEVTNYAVVPAEPPIRICYSLDGETVIYDTIMQQIPVDGSIVFTFDQTVDMSEPAIFENVFATTLQDDDEAIENDTLKELLYALPTVELPNLNPFDEEITFWRPGGTSPSWEYGVPAGGKISSPATGVYAWVTNLRGRYNDNEYSYIESPCYDLSSADRPILQLQFFAESEAGVDGVNMLYSIDDGASWDSIEIHETYDFGWNWYDTPVSALGSNGKSGLSTGWELSKVVLPDEIIGESKVKFRVAFASDDENNFYEGVAIDDIHLYEAPVDIGIESIDNLYDTCQAENPEQVQVTIKNYGIRPVKAGDTVIVGIKLNNDPTKIDSFQLASELVSNGTMQYTFNSRIKLDEVGPQTVRAFTLVENDPLFYGFASNDTFQTSYTIIQSPITNLKDTIATNVVDTVTLRPFYDVKYSYIWNDGDTNRIKDTLFFGNYVLTVTDEIAKGGNGCRTIDTSRIQWLYSDVGMRMVMGPKNDCELDPVSYITVGVSNEGNDTIRTGTKIVAAFHIDSGAQVIDTITLPLDLWPQKVYPYTFAGDPVDLSQKDKYHVLTYTKFEGDTINKNDTAMRYIRAYGYPSVEIGNDTIYHRGLFKVLKAEVAGGSGSGGGSANEYTPYLWNDSTTSQNYLAEETGKHWVTYTDKYGCADSDTSYVFFLIRDIGPVEMISPVTQCGIPNYANVGVDWYNFGTDTVPIGTQFPIAYEMTWKDAEADTVKVKYSPVLDTMVIQSDVVPGAKYTHVFDDKYIEDAGKYEYKIYRAGGNDFFTANDTIDSLVYFNPQPFVDFAENQSGSYVSYKKTNVFRVDLGGNKNYYPTWNDGSHADSLVVTHNIDDALIYCTLTDTTSGCFDRDTFSIIYVYSDISLVSVQTEAEVCASDFKNVNVVVRNSGSSALPLNNNNVFIYYTYNQSPPVKDTIYRMNQLDVMATYLHTIDNMNIVANNNVDITFYLSYFNDIDQANDTIVKNIDIKKSPFVDFGANQDGVLYVSNYPVTLNASQSEQSSYVWGDGSPSSSYTVSRDGEYEVTIEYLSNGCAGTFSVSVKQGVYISENEDYDIMVYPNPTSEKLNIQFNESIQADVQIRLVDMSGKTLKTGVYEKENNRGLVKIDINGIQPGIYILNFINANKQQAVKVAIE